MKNRQKPTHHHLTALIIAFGMCLVLLVFAFNFFKQPNTMRKENTSLTMRSTIYHSKSLKFSIVVPSDYQIEEQFTAITLTSDKGVVIADRAGTNFSNIDEYANTLEELNKISIVEREKMRIDNLEAMRATIKHPISNKPDVYIYYIYKEHSLYSISTTSPSLYSDADSIARSFRYLPQ